MTFRQLKYQITSYITDLQYIPFKLLRAIQYGIKSWNIHDFDHSSVTIMTQYAMERLEPCIRNGYNMLAEKRAKELRIMINLLDRMNRENEVYYYLHEDLTKKYPRIPCITETEEFNTYRSRNPNYIKEFRRVYKQIEYLENRDVEEFCRRFKKIRVYWD